MVEFRLLGPVEILVGPQRLDAGLPRQRAVLAALLADAGQLVSVDSLVDRVWADDPPASVRQTLHSYIAGVRRALRAAARLDGAPVGLVYRSGGYVLEADRHLVDLHCFRRLTAQAGQRERAIAERAAMLREAVALWRGEALAGLGGPWVARKRDAWERERLDAVVAWAQAELAMGAAQAVLVPLRDLAAEHPLAEPLTATLMRALCATGRPGEALDRYTATRHSLREELGTDPGRELQSLHTAILRGELVPSVSSSAPQPTVPAQLPLAPGELSGRARELARLDDWAAAGSRPAVLITGAAGTGKTALAVHWARRAAPSFPDGQLYANLRGFDPSGTPVSPTRVLRGFLEALGVPPQEVPVDEEARAGLYRGVLAGKRVLIVLDNARDAQQVRPMLPGDGAGVVVTSRADLTSLVVSDCARPLVLGLLPPEAARDLIHQRLGPRAADEPAAVADLVSVCAGLPLALCVVAARAVTRPGLALTAIAAQLREATGVLDALETGDLTTSVRAVFSWSHDAVSPAAARLFRLLGLHPGPDIGYPAAASLAAVRPAEAAQSLAELARANLVQEVSADRVTMHDLLRAYARELASEDRAATERMLDHYLHSACAADRLLGPVRDPVALPAAAAGTTPERFADGRAAWVWLEREHDVLIGVVERAVAAGFDRHAWQVPWAIATFQHRRGMWHERVATQRIALAAGRRLADLDAQARAQHSLGFASIWLRRYRPARAWLTRALDLHRQLGDRAGQARCHVDLALVFERLDQLEDALAQAREALRLYREIGSPTGQARSLNSVGWYHTLLGDHRRALEYCHQALVLYGQLGNQRGQADTCDSIGRAHQCLGQLDRAIAFYRRSVRGFQEVGDRYNHASTLTRLGDTQHANADPEAANASWALAAGILEELRHPDAAAVRAKLATADMGRWRCRRRT